MQTLSKETFIYSLPQGASFRKNEKVALMALIYSEAVNLSNEYLRDVIMPELVFFATDWNPLETLRQWESLFGLDDLIYDKDTNQEYRNILLRLLVDMMKVRSYPASLNKLNAILEKKYEYLGLAMEYGNSRYFTFGKSRFGNYQDSHFGRGIGTVILTVNFEKPYAQYFPVFVRLLSRILPIWTQIQTEFPFTPGEGLPDYNKWQIIHDCNFDFYFPNAKTKIVPSGKWQLGTYVGGFEDNYITVNNSISFPLDYFRALIKENFVYFSFWLKNSNAQQISARAKFVSSSYGPSEIIWRFDDVSLQTWTFCAVKISMPREILVQDLVHLDFYADEGRIFFIDQLRMYGGDSEQKGYEIFINQEILYKQPDDIQTNNAIAIYLNGFYDELAKFKGEWHYATLVELLQLYDKFGLELSPNEDSFAFGTANKSFGAMLFEPYVIASLTNPQAEYAFAADLAAEMIDNIHKIIYRKGG